ncbi:hypothetical protein IQ289_38455 [Burkholderia sp. R-70006]|uniref:hypothetical protein n=1 Tax=Paraburkholderia domus TaxID=2793075 RepID=UPI0019135FA6|nr:hypothetical protein [Paraburkholderia domus]MBK5054251.1 hypothetical protein [Burkholderia sp. R-70006]
MRDNDQRTCFLLVWSDSGDGAAVLATSRTFRTIRTAISEGVARFGTMAVRRKMPLSGAAQPPERV